MGSDLVSNTLRGAFGEYLVSLAVGAADGVQEEWADYDVRTSDGLRIEVKTSGYVQSWKQSNLSSPTFDIGRKQGWDAGTNTFTEHKRRWSDVYVFCLHHYQDKISIDPLDMTQWTFYVLATTVLEREIPEQKRIGLGSLKRLGTISVQFEGISDAIRTAVANR